MALRTFAARHFQARTLTYLSGLHSVVIPLPYPAPQPKGYWEDADDEVHPYLTYYPNTTDPSTEALILLMVAAAMTILEP